MSVQKIVEDYIRKHPSLKDSLTKDIVNYSKLARLIVKGSSLHLGFDAVVVGLRRLQKKLEKNILEEEIKELLKETRLEVKNRMVVFILKKNVEFKALEKIYDKCLKERIEFNVVQSSSAITLIIENEMAKECDLLFKGKVIKKHNHVLEVILKSDEKVEEVPGVLSHLFRLFGEHGINVIETFSCYKDTVLVIAEKDIEKVVEVVRF